jgi:hypothetical protein
VVLIFEWTILIPAASGAFYRGGGIPQPYSEEYLYPNEFLGFYVNFSEHSKVIVTGEPLPLHVKAFVFAHCGDASSDDPSTKCTYPYNGRNLHLSHFMMLPLSDYQFRVRLSADCGPECLRYPPTWIGHIYETNEETRTKIYTTDVRGGHDLEFISMQPGNYTITIEGIKYTGQTYPCPNNGLNIKAAHPVEHRIDLSQIPDEDNIIYQADPVTTTITVISPPPSGSASWSISPSEKFSVEIHAWPLTVQTGKPSQLEVIVWKDGLPEIGREIEITSSGGMIEAPFGITDAAGIYTTNFTAGLEGTYFVTARSAQGEEAASSTTAIKVVKGPVQQANGESPSDPGFSPAELLEGDQRIPSRLLEPPDITLHTVKTHIRPSEITSIDVAVIDCVRPEYDAEISVFVNGKMDHTENVKTSCRSSPLTAVSFPFSSKEEGVFVIGAQGTDWKSQTPPIPTGIKVYVSSKYTQPQAGEPKSILDMIFSIPAQIVGLFSGGSAIAGGVRETVPVVQPTPPTIQPVRTSDAVRTVRVATPLSRDEVPGQNINVPPSTCRAGYISCSEVCVDPLTDPDNCGSCGNACRPPASCRNGICVAPLASPAVPATSVTSPPVDCGKMGLTSCGGTCVDLKTNSLHCGSCLHTCQSPASCRNGVCTAMTVQQPKPAVTVTKPPVNCEILGKMSCSGTCVDLLTDWNNCGSCGRACPTGNTCEAGKCCMPVINPLTHTIQKVCEQ